MKRRRFITITAATASGLASCRGPRGTASHRWHGVLFNADVDLTLQGMPEAAAEELTRTCVEEMLRLEGIFSLYQPQSTLCRLNRDAAVKDPPREFHELVALALELAEETEGAFDPTIQPYWRWLGKTIAGGHEWDEAEHRRQLARVDYREVECSDRRVRFRQPGMGMTLNGIAQGYITDRIAAHLRAGAAQHCLVNLGEFAAVGTQRSGRPWEVAIRGLDPAVPLILRDGALAVSSGSGHFFGAGSQANHLIHPTTGRSPDPGRTVVVSAPDAVIADALSTAAAVLDDTGARALEAVRPGVRVQVHPGGAGVPEGDSVA